MLLSDTQKKLFQTKLIVNQCRVLCIQNHSWKPKQVFTLKGPFDEFPCLILCSETIFHE